jgi:hypothetical protein
MLLKATAIKNSKSRNVRGRVHLEETELEDTKRTMSQATHNSCGPRKSKLSDQHIDVLIKQESRAEIIEKGKQKDNKQLDLGGFAN